jgi:hypothetical protein
LADGVISGVRVQAILALKTGFARQHQAVWMECSKILKADNRGRKELQTLASQVAAGGLEIRGCGASDQHKSGRQAANQPSVIIMFPTSHDFTPRTMGSYAQTGPAKDQSLRTMMFCRVVADDAEKVRKLFPMDDGQALFLKLFTNDLAIE